MNLIALPRRAGLLTGLLYLASFPALALDEITFDSVTVMISGEEFNLEIADNWQRRQRGLMYREKLDERSGMVFIYPVAGDHRIWMKNTFIPLTVVWLDKSARVIDVKKLTPCRQTKCPVYGADSPSKYILELNVEFNSLKKGDYVPALLSL